LSGNATLYAQWTASSFTVTFIANGGAPVASQVVSSGGSISSLPSDTQTGYTLTVGVTAPIPLRRNFVRSVTAT